VGNEPAVESGKAFFLGKGALFFFHINRVAGFRSAMIPLVLG